MTLSTDSTSPFCGEQTRTIHSPVCTGQVRTAAPLLQRGTTVLLDESESFTLGRPTYGRGGLATHATLRAALCDLEQGEVCELYPSGLAALSGAMLALCRAGDEILMVDTIYGPTRRFAHHVMADYGVTLRMVPADITAGGLTAMLAPNTRLLVMESPGSLTLDMMDVRALGAAARAAGVLTLVDNTYGAGVLFKPLDHGVDVSVQSLSKYVCGHSDVFMGAAIARGPVGAMLNRSAKAVGWHVSSDDAYSALRGLKTLHCRLAQHGASALRVGTWLQRHPTVREVLCPALPGTSGHALFTRDFTGANGLVSFALDGPTTLAPVFLDRLRLIGLGFSWGGYESLAIPCNAQLAARAFDGPRDAPLIRLHVGLETAEDIIAELDAALQDFTRMRDAAPTPGAQS